MYQSYLRSGKNRIKMIARPLILVIICFGFFILLQSLLPKVMALKGSSRVNEFLLENQRTRKRKNYVFRMDRDNEILKSDSPCNSYDTMPVQPDTSPEELPEFIIDYANMIRDDVFLLDNSVETRTRKRGNIKVKKDNLFVEFTFREPGESMLVQIRVPFTCTEGLCFVTFQAIPDQPCNCIHNKTTEDFGPNSIPRHVETRYCSEVQPACRPPYICKENLYELIYIKRRDVRFDSKEVTTLPYELKYKWITEKRNISVGCVCSRDYIIEN